MCSFLDYMYSCLKRHISGVPTLFCMHMQIIIVCKSVFMIFPACLYRGGWSHIISLWNKITHVKHCLAAVLRSFARLGGYFGMNIFNQLFIILRGVKVELMPCDQTSLLCYHACLLNYLVMEMNIVYASFYIRTIYATFHAVGYQAKILSTWRRL